MAITKSQKDRLTQQTSDALTNKYASEVYSFVTNGDPLKTAESRLRTLYIDVVQNRELYNKSLGNVLTRTRTELGISPDFGTSRYDQYATMLSQMQDPTDLRAERQSGGLKIVNGMFGALTTAATTYAEPFATIASTYFWFDPADPTTSRWNNFVNSPIQQGLQNMDKVFSNLAPIYRSNAERDPSLNLFQRMGSSGWWAEDFIKNIGFTVGAALSGKHVGLGIDWLLNKAAIGVLKRNPVGAELFKNTSKVLGKEAAVGEDISKLIEELQKLETISEHEQLIKQLTNTQRVKTAVGTFAGMTVGAATEAHIEALQARESFVDNGLSHLDRFYNPMSIGARMEYTQAKEDGTIDPNMSLQQFCELKKQEAKQILNKNADKVMNFVYAAETMLLFMTNAIAWRDWYDVSFHATGHQLRQSKRFIQGDLKNDVKNVKFRQNRLSAMSLWARAAGVEGLEEMLQSGIVEGADQYYGSATNKLYRDAIIRTDPAYEQRTLRVIEATWRGLQHAFGTHDSWTEGFIGGIMGAFGLPGRTMTKAQRKAEGISVFNPKAWEMKGGLADAYRKNKADREYAREFVNKVQEVFSTDEVPSEILRKYSQLEAAMLSEQDAIFDGNKRKKLDAAATRRRLLLDIFRLTDNYEDVELMYQNLANITDHMTGTPLTEEQQSIVNDAKEMVLHDNPDATFQSDEEILRHINKHAHLHAEEAKKYLTMTQSLMQMLNMYENQLTQTEKKTALALMQQCLFTINDNKIRSNDIRHKYDQINPELIETGIKLLNDLSNSKLYFSHNVSLLDESGRVIERDVLKRSLVKELTDKLLDARDSFGNSILDDTLLAKTNEIATEIIEMQEMQKDNYEYMKTYAELLKDTVGQIKQFEIKKQEHLQEKDRRSTQQIYDQIIKTFEDIESQTPDQYDENEIVRTLRPLINKLRESKDSSFYNKLLTYAQKYVNGRPVHQKAFHYFSQLTEMMDAKNSDVEKLKSLIPQDMYNQLLDVLPARAQELIDKWIQDKNVDTVTRQNLSNFVSSIKGQFWYKSKDNNQYLYRTGASSGDDVISRRRMGTRPQDSGTIYTQTGVSASSVDDAANQIKSLIEAALKDKDQLGEALPIDVNYDSEKQTLQISYKPFDPKNLNNEDFYKLLSKIYGIVQLTISFKDKKVNYTLLDRFTKQEVVNITFPYVQDYEKSYNTIVQTLTHNSQIIEDSKNLSWFDKEAQKLPASLDTYLTPIIRPFLVEEQTEEHFIFFYRPGFLLVNSNKAKQYNGASTKYINTLSQINNLINAAMSGRFKSAESSNEPESQSNTTNSVIQYDNGYYYHNDAIEELNKYNDKLTNEGQESIIDFLDPQRHILQNSSTEQLTKWAQSMGLNVITDEDNHVIGFTFNDPEHGIYNNKQDLIRSQRVWFINDTFTLASHGKIFTVSEIDNDGNIIKAVSSDGTTVQVSYESNGARVHIDPLQKPTIGVSVQSTYNGVRTTIPISEWDYADDDNKESNLAIKNRARLKDFPSLTNWLRSKLKDAYDNVGFGYINKGDVVHFRIVTMDNIDQKERNQIQDAYKKIDKHGHLIGNDKIIECYVQKDGKEYSIGFLNPVGGYAKTAIISEAFSQGFEEQSNVNLKYTTVIESISDNHERVYFYDDDQKSNELLKENFDKVIFVVKINGKLHCSQDITKLPQRLWNSVKNDKTMTEGQLYMIPYSSSVSSTPKPVALIYGMTDQNTNNLKDYLLNHLLLYDLLSKVREALTSQDIDVVNELSLEIKKALNDLFYIENGHNEIFVTIDVATSKMILSVKDENDKPIISKQLENTENISLKNLQSNLTDADFLNETENVVNEILQFFLQRESGIRISGKMVDEALSQRDVQNQPTLYSYISNNFIKTTAANIRTSNAHPILKSNALDKEEKASKDNKKTLPPDNAVNKNGDTYNVKQQNNNVSFNWARYSENNYEVSTKGDSRFSARVAKFREGTILFGHDVGGRTIESVYQHGVKQGDWVTNNNDKTGAPNNHDIIIGNTEDYSYQQGYLPLWIEWVRQNPDLIADLREKANGKTLTDQFAKSKVSQARALADILNNPQLLDINNENNNVVENQKITEEPALVEVDIKPIIQSKENQENLKKLYNEFRNFVNNVDLTDDDIKKYLNNEVLFNTDFPKIENLDTYYNLQWQHQNIEFKEFTDQITDTCEGAQI